MSDVSKQLALVRGAYPKAELWSEGGRNYVYIAGIQFESRAGKVRADALLCPGEHPGYPTRLFLSRKIEGTGANFNSNAVIGGRSWNAASWDNVPAALPWLEILASHLRAFQ